MALVPSLQAGMAAAVTVILRQAGFAVGIAVPDAVLGQSGEAASYAWMFLVAALACAVASISAFLLLPPAAEVWVGREKQS